MITIPPFQHLCDDGFPDLSKCCIPRKIKDDLTIYQVLRRLTGNGINLETSSC